MRDLTRIAALVAVLGMMAAGGYLVRAGIRPGDPALAAPEPGRSLRIVSLSPALTRMAVDLGLGDLIVGRSSFCTAVSTTLPVAGDLFTIDFERMIELRPDVILRQAPRDADETRLDAMAARHGWRLVSVRSLDGLDDIRSALRRFADEIVPDAAAAVTMQHRLDHVTARMDAVLSPPKDGWRGGVLLIHSLDPLGVFGPGSYLGDVLEALGAKNAATGAAWSSMSLEDLVRLDPPAIILVRMHASSDETAKRFGPVMRLDIEAVRSNRLAVLASEDVMAPSTSVIGAAQDMAALLRRFGGEPEAHP